MICNNTSKGVLNTLQFVLIETGQIKDFLLTNHADSTVIRGDFNLVLDQTIDTKNYKHVNNPNAQKAVKDMMN